MVGQVATCSDREEYVGKKDVGARKGSSMQRKEKGTRPRHMDRNDLIHLFLLLPLSRVTVAGMKRRSEAVGDLGKRNMLRVFILEHSE